jgi:hypothetical protein
MRGTLIRMLTYLPHTCLHCLSNKTQVCGDQASFVNVPSTKSYRSVIVDVAHMFLGITLHRSFHSPLRG